MIEQNDRPQTFYHQLYIFQIIALYQTIKSWLTNDFLIEKRIAYRLHHQLFIRSALGVLNYINEISRTLKLCLATVIHNFKSLKITWFQELKVPTDINISSFQAYFTCNNLLHNRWYQRIEFTIEKVYSTDYAWYSTISCQTTVAWRWSVWHWQGPLICQSLTDGDASSRDDQRARWWLEYCNDHSTVMAHVSDSLL